ncbi:MAG TPA: MBL fold metallo-hydrolase, partial [Candidatus Solibacter sp.]|nr:MBL fold metallo-hydrolase [Candidatus Solibacter sp.]
MATTKKKSAPAAKKTAPASSKKKSTHAGPRATVRMYRQGLGDCFLITFPRADGSPFHMVIDCGVVLGTPDAASKMQAIVSHLRDATAKHIDLLVATHEHWDHLSGFTKGHAQSIFDEIVIDRVWLAWTEDPADPLAKTLRAERRSAENALRMAVTRLGVTGDQNSSARVGSVVEFFGAKAGSTGEALDYVKKRASGKPKYCKPGEPAIELPEVPGVRFWILGPPKDEKLIKKSNPSQGAAYGLDAGANGSQSFFIAGVTAGMAAAADVALPDSPPSGPFDAMYCIPLSRAEHLPFFEGHYFGAVSDTSLAEKV